MSSGEFLKGQVVRVTCNTSLHQFAGCSVRNSLGILRSVAVDELVVVAEAPEQGVRRTGVFVHYYPEGVPQVLNGIVDPTVTTFISGYIRRELLQSVE